MSISSTWNIYQPHHELYTSSCLVQVLAGQISSYLSIEYQFWRISGQIPWIWIGYLNSKGFFIHPPFKIAKLNVGGYRVNTTYRVRPKWLRIIRVLICKEIRMKSHKWSPSYHQICWVQSHEKYRYVPLRHVPICLMFQTH